MAQIFSIEAFRRPGKGPAMFMESGQDARIMETNFCAAFDRINHQGFFYKI